MNIGVANPAIFDVDDDIGSHDVKLHEIDECRPSRQKLDLGGGIAPRRNGGLRGGGRCFCLFVSERAHGYSLLAVFMVDRACSTAETMLG